jgi:hypothetical protein
MEMDGRRDPGLIAGDMERIREGSISNFVMT